MNYIDLLKPEQLEVFQEAISRQHCGLNLPMGYGKTIIGIILMLEIMKRSGRSGKCLWVCSKSLINNVVKQLTEHFHGEISYYVYHSEYHPEYNGRGSAYYADVNNINQINAKIVITTIDVTSSQYSDLHLEESLTERVLDQSGPFDHYKTNYIVPQSAKSYGGLIYGTNWECLIVDEFHKFSNIEANNCRSLLCIPARRKYALSGTLLNKTKPENILSYFMFIEETSLGINTSELTNSIKSKNFKGYNEYLISRDQINFEVQTVENIVNITMYPEEEIIYRGFRQIIVDLINEKEKMKGKDTEKMKKITGNIIAMLSKLRLAIVSPLIPLSSIYIDLEKKGKSDQILNFMSLILETLEMRSFLQNPANLISSRIAKVLDLASQHERVIVFSAYRKTLDFLQYFIEKPEYGINRQYITIEGNYSLKKRTEAEYNLTNMENYISGLTYETGGVGLNIQNANCVILMDYDWESTNREQALARVVRQGQNQVVHIYYMVCNAGVENAILKKQLEKKMVAKELRSGPASTQIESIKIDQLMELLEREIAEEKIEKLKAR